jgi:uncharacterized membrane protein YcaP (DUF421 family)
VKYSVTIRARTETATAGGRYTGVEFLATIFGAGEASRDIAIPQMIARAILMYLALVVLMRLGKKRFLGDATVFDIVLSIVIGSIAGRTITGGAPLLPSLGAIAALIALHWFFSWIGVRSPAFASLIKGRADVIIRDGKPDRAAMRSAHMGEDDLAEDLRIEGVGDPRDVKEARLERSGKLSVIKREKN